ncbi:MAG: hypothetical protein HPY83_19110 [Anaerolineae bacterium]|nr:hypothetical protein [Anaerolineae bacterium]
MDTVTLPRTGLTLSPLGMGTVPMVSRVPTDERVGVVRAVRDLGINWFDTARAYNDAEDVLGEAFAGSRHEVVIITKSGAKEPERLRLSIEESLRRLRTDYVDALFFHGGGAIETECFLGPGGLLEAAEDCRRAGKTRFLGFSAHSVDLAVSALDIPSFDFAMVPANFMSPQYIQGAFMERARERGVTVLAMKPFGGGRIRNPGLCLKFLKRFPDVLPCVGIEKPAEMAEDLRLWDEAAGPLTVADQAEMERIHAELGDRFCRQCGYCMPCPEGVPIMFMNLMEAWVKQLSLSDLVHVAGGAVEAAKGCVECRKCVEKCPYDLPIPEMLKDSIALYERTVALGAADSPRAAAG